MTVSLEVGVMLLSGVFTVSAALSMVLVVLAQPRLRFGPSDYVLIAFYLMLALASGLSFLRHLNPEWSLHLLLRLQIGALALVVVSYLTFIAQVLEFDAQALRLKAGIVALLLLIGLILTWDSAAFSLAIDGTVTVTTTGRAGLAALAAGFGVCLWLVLNSHHRAAAELRLPTLLLVTGAALTVIVALRPLPVDAVFTLAGAGMLGWRRVHALIREPYTTLQTELRTVNRDLQQALGEVEKGQRRVEQMARELRAVGQSQTEYLVRMGHELRTPLNSIIGYSELMRDGYYGELTDTQADRMRRLHQNGLRLLAILDDILDLNRIDSGMLRLEPVAFQLSLVAQSVIQQMQPRCVQQSLELNLKLADDLPVLFGDEVRIRQVIYNLLDNSIKFTDEGSVTLSASYVRVRQGHADAFPLPAIGWLRDGEWVVIGVADTGSGIAPEDQGRIFDEFVQVNVANWRNHVGTGLGLAITRRLVEMHGGSIWVKSAPGQGSTFYVALPADIQLRAERAS